MPKTPSSHLGKTKIPSPADMERWLKKQDAAVERIYARQRPAIQQSAPVTQEDPRKKALHRLCIRHSLLLCSIHEITRSIIRIREEISSRGIDPDPGD
jgi:hypothetical protein